MNPFSFKHTDTRNNSNVLLHTSGSNLFLSDKYLQVDFELPSKRIFGFGDRNANFSLGEGTWTMWAKDSQQQFDNGSGGLQGSSVHPFALVQTAIPGQFFGIYFRNTNAQSPVIYHKNDGGATLSYITTGGAIEVFFFWKGSAKSIVQQFQQLIGTPQLPPIYALGWHIGS